MALDTVTLEIDDNYIDPSETLLGGKKVVPQKNIYKYSCFWIVQFTLIVLYTTISLLFVRRKTELVYCGF